MYDIDTIDTQQQSVTATICENARLFGATPERGEFDPRDVWDRDEATGAVSKAFRILSSGVGPDGLQMLSRTLFEGEIPGLFGAV